MSATFESSPDVLGVHAHLLASIPGILILLDSRGTVRFASGQVERLGGQTVDILVGSDLSSHLEPKDRPILSWLLSASATRSPEQLTGPVRLPFLDSAGRPRITEAWALNRLADPALGGFVILLLVESAYDHFDQVLAAAQAGAGLEENLAALAVGLRLPPVHGECFFVVASADGRTVSCYPPRPAAPAPPASGPWDQAMGHDASVLYTEIDGLPDSTRAAAAQFRSVSCFPVPTRGENAPSACLVVWSRDLGPLGMTEQTAVDRALVLASLLMSHNVAKEHSREDGHGDALTGLGNRRSYFQALESRVAAGDRPAVLYVDIDGFKEVNERLGRLAGDSALRVIARRLSSIVRPSDELARFGGDEFAILCASDVTETQVVSIAARVVERLSEPISIGDAPALKVGASIGIVFNFPEGTTSDTLLASADEALCAAKAAGRGCWRFAGLPEDRDS